jgi:DNA-binding transcriptional LysR family regulator
MDYNLLGVINSLPLAMNITSRQLRAFLLTARYQSFSRAADQLFITQSGMSVLVRELEAQLGFRLFERTTRRVTLTEFGSKFLPIADRSLVDLEYRPLGFRAARRARGRRCALRGCRRPVAGHRHVCAARSAPAGAADRH